MKKRKLLPILLALAMVLTMIPASVFAAENENVAEVVEINSNADLVNAITGQQEGQTWVFTKEGVYDAKNTASGSAGNYAVPSNLNGNPFALPIYVDNLTVKKAEGVGDVTLTSTYQPAATSGGNWHEQNFITVFGSNLTIEGINIQANKNLYYGTCNKVIELTGEAKDLTLKNINIIPVENNEGKSFGGSIYFDVADAGNSSMQNVTMDAWISAGKVGNGTIKIDNLVQDFSNSEYAGYSSEEGEYLWNPTIKGTKVEVTNHKVIVDGETNLIKQIFNDMLRKNTVIELAGDVEIDSMLSIKTPGVTLDLNGHKITASKEFKSTYENDSHLLNIEGANVTVKNGTLTATDKNKHVLNVYNAEGFTAEDLTLDHSKAYKGAPLVINNSDVTVKGKLDLVTGENSWYGINVDSKGGEASLEFAEGSEVQMTGVDGLNVIKAENSSEGGKAPVITGAEDAGLIPNENGTYESAYDVYLNIKYVTEEGKSIAEETFTEKSAAGDFKWVYNENYQINIPKGYELVKYDGIYETMTVKVAADAENITEGNVVVKASQAAGKPADKPGSKPDSSAQTGDDSNMAIPLAAAGLALAAMAAVIATRKRHS